MLQNRKCRCYLIKSAPCIYRPRGGKGSKMTVGRLWGHLRERFRFSCRNFHKSLEIGLLCVQKCGIKPILSEKSAKNISQLVKNILLARKNGLFLPRRTLINKEFSILFFSFLPVKVETTFLKTGLNALPERKETLAVILRTFSRVPQPSITVVGDFFE